MARVFSFPQPLDAWSYLGALPVHAGGRTLSSRIAKEALPWPAPLWGYPKESVLHASESFGCHLSRAHIDTTHDERAVVPTEQV